MYLIMLGAQGTGKGTVAGILAKGVPVRNKVGRGLLFAFICL